MKKHLLLLAFLSPVFLPAMAQQPDMANTLVHYKFSHLRDTTKPNEPYKENMMLMIGKNATAYKSYDRRLADLQVKKQIQEQLAANGGNGPIRIQRKNGGSGTEYYMFPKENKFVRKEKLINNYLIDEPYPAIAWRVTADTMTLAGLHCQKATTHFKGRDYTAWFCPDIPVHGGPWKLSGLPGLILEAYDTKKEVIFSFDGIEDLTKTAAAKTANDLQPARPEGMVKMIGFDDADQDPRLIQLPADAIKTTQKEFLRLQDAMRKDPDAFMQSAMAGNGANMNSKGNQTHAKLVITTPVENNPVELPEKK
jgi:GLPGLI family protein